MLSSFLVQPGSLVLNFETFLRTRPFRTHAQEGGEENYVQALLASSTRFGLQVGTSRQAALQDCCSPWPRSKHYQQTIGKAGKPCDLLLKRQMASHRKEIAQRRNTFLPSLPILDAPVPRLIQQLQNNYRTTYRTITEQLHNNSQQLGLEAQACFNKKECF